MLSSGPRLMPRESWHYCCTRGRYQRHFKSCDKNKEIGEKSSLKLLSQESSLKARMLGGTAFKRMTNPVSAVSSNATIHRSCRADGATKPNLDTQIAITQSYYKQFTWPRPCGFDQEGHDPGCPGWDGSVCLQIFTTLSPF